MVPHLVRLLHFLVVSTRGYGRRPVSVRQAVWSIRRSIGVDLNKSWATLHRQLVPWVVVEFERSDEAITRITGIRALSFAEWGRMGPKARLCAHYTRLPHQRMSLGATEGD